MSDHKRPDGFVTRASGEIRVDPSGDRRLKGYAIVFHKKSVDLGGFREIILPEAVDRTIREAADVRALIDHDSGKVIGRTRAGTMRIKADTRGLHVDIELPNTSLARDLFESVDRGDITGMSFAFRTITDEWRMEDGEVIREVSDMDVREVSVVAFPAYVQTSVDAETLRSLQLFQQKQVGRNVAFAQKWHRTKIAS